MAYIGTLEWAHETGGTVRLHEKFQLAGLAARLLPSLPSWILYKLGRSGRGDQTVELDALLPPSTPATLEARAQLAKLAPDYIVNHSERTYLLSRLLANPADQPLDAEMLYIASLAHDVGLCRSTEATCNAQCFSIRSAKWAADIASACAWGNERVRKLAEAITLHLNGCVPPRMGIEAHLMMRGVLLDATGIGASRVNPATLENLFDRIPRLQQKEMLPALFSAEAARYPSCRGRFAVCWLGFGFLMRHVPW